MESLIERVNRPRAPQDGLGWLVDYLCRLVSFYPSFTRRFVLDELPMIEGWAWYAFAMENNAMNQLGGIEKTSPGYVRQEKERLIAQAHEFWAALDNEK